MFEVHAGGARAIVVRTAADVPSPSTELVGALRFLLIGLEGTNPASVARAIARFVAVETRCAGAVSAELVEAGVRHPAEVPAIPSMTVEESVFGCVDVVDEDDAFGVYRLRIAPGRAIPTHEHRHMDEWEYALRGGLVLQGEAFPLGDAVRWPAHFPHRWENRTERESVVLCIDRPRFDASDEVLVTPPTLERCPLRFRPLSDSPSHP